jgi:hypothetical protein
VVPLKFVLEKDRSKMPKGLKFLFTALIVAVGVTVCGAQGQLTQTPAGPPDNSKEPYILQSVHTALSFENDGTLTRELTGRVRLQSEAGVQQFGLLKFGYTIAGEEIKISYVRVRKTAGA